MTNVKDVDETVIPEEPTKEQVELSKEELAARRKEITDYYKENIKHLKIQLEYEDLLMNIEKTRAERIQAQMFLAQATQQEGDPTVDAAAAFAQAQAGQEQEFSGEAPRRTLKRTE